MAKVLYFPDILQNTSFSCGNSCVQAVMAYYGFEYTERKLIKTLRTSKKWGTKSEHMVNFFIGKKFKVKSGNFSIEELKKCIKKEIPVIILIQAWGPKEIDYTRTNQFGHYVVVSGYNKRGLIIEDPAIFGRGFISYSQLKKRWHADDEEKVYNWGLAVWGKRRYDYSRLYNIT